MKRAIAITGSFSAGSGTAATILGELLPGSFVASYSGELSKTVSERGLFPTRENLHNTANELRAADPQALAKRVVAAFRASGKRFLIAEKLRSEGDLHGLRAYFGKQLVLLSIDAPLELRYRRAIARRRAGEEKLSLEQFVESELKENKPRASEGEMNISALMKKSEYSIQNEGSEAELRKKLHVFLGKYGFLPKKYVGKNAAEINRIPE